MAQVATKATTAATEVLKPAPEFQPFQLIVGNEIRMIRTTEAKQQLMQELMKKVSENHTKIEIRPNHIMYETPKPCQSPELVQAFVEECKTHFDVIPARHFGEVSILPKKTEEHMEGHLLIRTYQNGVREEVHCTSPQSPTDWEGKRIYPNGHEEDGRFEAFSLSHGVYRVAGVVKDYIIPYSYKESNDTDQKYPLPTLLVTWREVDSFNFIFDTINEKETLVLVKRHTREHPDSNHYYHPAEGNLISILAEVLSDNYYRIGSGLRNLFGFPKTTMAPQAPKKGHIDFAQFMKYLCTENDSQIPIFL